MGNCLFGGLGMGGEEEEPIRVVTWNGGVMELGAPITAECITAEFPGHGIFRSHDLFWKPLPHHHHLLPGHSYYLLPLVLDLSSHGTGVGEDHSIGAQVGHVRSNSIPTTTSFGGNAPYRMSFDHPSHRQGLMQLKRSQTEVVSASRSSSSLYNNKIINNKSENTNNVFNGGGIWKVKLVISPEQLLQILSREASTQELIESVRTVAKCGNYGLSAFPSSSSSSVAFSDDDHCSLSATSCRIPAS
ncbi:uncharacterized protein LOC131157655 [Malania oleifera]|uniref:uncharacterized protein LOC131157655 n=1 Tax=Malania oleifera TaxID=397392 RepID=UPI0025ADB073|nr:uncharacterized protein LOC131157655 [Malania oleifera]